MERLGDLLGRNDHDNLSARLEVFAVARSFSDSDLRRQYLSNHQLLLTSLERVLTRLSPAVPPSAAARILDTFLMGLALIGALEPEEERAGDISTILSLLLEEQGEVGRKGP